MQRHNTNRMPDAPVAPMISTAHIEVSITIRLSELRGACVLGAGWRKHSSDCPVGLDISITVPFTVGKVTQWSTVWYVIASYHISGHTPVSHNKSRFGWVPVPVPVVVPVTVDSRYPNVHVSTVPYWRIGYDSLYSPMVYDFITSNIQPSSSTLLRTGSQNCTRYCVASEWTPLR